MILCPDIPSAARVLADCSHALILTHIKPDGDAAGAALALRELMIDNGRTADVLLPESLPSKFLELAGDRFLTRLPGPGRTGYTALILLDCANDERIGRGDWEIPADLPVLNIDHHRSNHVTADWSYIQSDAAATCEIVLHLAQELRWNISPQAASFLLLGLVTDTGSFRFQNTSPATLRAAARLRELGADWDGVINAAFFSKSRNQQAFEAEMLSCCVQSACEGRYLYAVLPEEMFARHNFNMKDGENLIDLLREVEGVWIAALIYPGRDGIKFSLRSKNSRFPVGPVAARFGGGGHLMAAGATVTGCTSPEEAAGLLKSAIIQLLEA